MNKQNGRRIGKKIGKILVNILLYVFLALCIFSLAVTVLSSKDTDGTAEIFGYQLRLITSDSMAPCELTDVSSYEIGSLPLRSMVFVQTVPDEEAEADDWYAALKVGDVLTFRYVYTNQVVITHRIVSITEKSDGGYLIELAGDNKNAESEQLNQTIDTSEKESANYVIGKVTAQSRALGLVLNVIKNPLGIVFVIIVPCGIIILLEVIRIVDAVTADRKKRTAEAVAQKDRELEELRKRLAELEKQAEPAQEEKEKSEE